MMQGSTCHLRCTVKTWVLTISLIFTYTFRLSSANFFASNMGKLMKRTEGTKKYLSLCTHLGRISTHGFRLSSAKFSLAKLEKQIEPENFPPVQ